MPFSPTFTLAGANALVPYLADEAVRIRTAFSRIREIDAARERAPAAHAGEQQIGAAAGHLVEDRAAHEAEIIDAVAALARAGAGLRLDPPGIEVEALRDGQPVRLHWLEGEDAFTRWRSRDGRLHEIDDPTAFGAPIEQ